MKSPEKDGKYNARDNKNKMKNAIHVCCDGFRHAHCSLSIIGNTGTACKNSGRGNCANKIRQRGFH